MNAHPIEWGELVPILAALTVLQIALVSVSKLIALSDLFKVKRFGHYSEAAATFSYCTSSLAAITVWWSGDPMTPIQPADRRHVTVEWLQVSTVIYVTLLVFLVMFLLPLHWFRWRIFTVYFGGLAIAILALAIAIFVTPEAVWATYTAVAITVIWVCYFLAWGIRHLNFIVGRDAFASHIRRRFVRWLNRKPVVQVRELSGSSTQARNQEVLMQRTMKRRR
ncbi:hypothetical protein BFN03_10910 [Rhodococcus sp. WMMA185]|uniref:hypothetical protein n=1 Tax=Rhodococcus sp. WMMA185 TaxID=679318 RepID=UPI00087903EA|nr:hypothetical protein [Rhodococcus sp. WMMA185]AOW92997.1 hypothetical protein BFN03_10910 [Rhodococcus sp. WMMA185]